MKKMKLDIQKFTTGTIMGSIGHDSYGNNFQAKVEWYETSYESTNKSDVRIVLYGFKNTQAATYGSDWSGFLSIAGQRYDFNDVGRVLYIANSWTYVIEYTFTNIAHNPDGTLTPTIAFKLRGPSGTSLANGISEGSESIALDTLYRQPVITYTTSTKTNSSITIGYTVTNASDSGNINEIQYSFNGETYNVAVSSSSSGTFTISGLTQKTDYSFDLYGKSIHNKWSEKVVFTERTYPEKSLLTSYSVGNITPFSATASITVTNQSNINYITYSLYKANRTLVQTANSSNLSYTFTTQEETEYYITIVVVTSESGDTSSGTTSNFTTPADQASVWIKTSSSVQSKGKAYIKTENGWVAAKKVFIKTSNGWVGNINN